MQPPTVREIIRRLEEENWQLARICGDHRVFRKGSGLVVVVSGSLGSTPKKGTYANIRRNAGW